MFVQFISSRSNRILQAWLIAGLMFSMLALCPAMGAAAPNPEALAGELGKVIVPLAGSALAPPVVRDLGNGFYSFSMPLSSEIRQQLEDSLQSNEPSESDKAQPALTVIAVGQAPELPPTPVAADHGALSDTTFPYTYWIITLNLGSSTVTKKTTWKLTGPGLKFTKFANVVYGAGGIWGIGFQPGPGVGVPGIYTFQGTVAGAGTMTTKSFAVNP
jgi:hypothetical protein